MEQITPMMVEIMMFHSYMPSGTLFPNYMFSKQQKSLKYLASVGLLKVIPNTRCYTITQRGRLYVRRVLQVQLVGEPGEGKINHA